MKRKLLVVSTATIITLMCGGANAACDKPSLTWDIIDNPTIKVPIVTDGAKCIHNYNGNYESAEILKLPKHGKLNQKSITQYVYVPDQNYKGTDSYSYKLCGFNNSGKKGCVIIQAEVNKI